MKFSLTCYWVLLQARLERIKLTQLWFVRETVLQLAERGQQSRAISLQLAILATHSVLNGEPEALKRN